MPTPQQVGRAGELFVAAELNRRGAIATLFLTNTPRVDVVASDGHQQRTVYIQVKTKGPHSKVWQWNYEMAKNEAKHAKESDFIVLVDLAEPTGIPSYYVAPLRELAATVAQAHEAWLNSHGGQRPRTPMSTHTSITIAQVAQWYRRWDILKVC